MKVVALKMKVPIYVSGMCAEEGEREHRIVREVEVVGSAAGGRAEERERREHVAHATKRKMKKQKRCDVRTSDQRMAL